MFVMMPQEQCADGSRVKNIKKQFEVLSHEAKPEVDVKFKCTSTSQNKGEVPGRQPCKSTVSSVVCEGEKCKISKSNVHLKESVVKNDKCNIKRSPAFRCDKIVKGKNVTGQAKDKHISVEDKVKLFEDGRVKICEPTTGKSQMVPEHPNDKRSGETKVILGVGKVNKSTDIPTKDLSNRDTVSINSWKSYNSSPDTSISAHLHVFETKVVLPSSLKPQSGDVCERIMQVNNGGFPRENTHVSTRDISSNKDNLRDILKSPLPRGPPPRKPPRTFAHSCQSVGNLNRLPKSSNSPKEGTKEILRSSTSGTSVTPTLVRSKTESQIELRNKLETALSKLQPGGEHFTESMGRSFLLETNKKSLTHPCRARPPSKPDLSPSSLLVGCLSLGCVSNHQYEEVGAVRQCQFFVGSSDSRERMDIRSSLTDAARKSDTPVSLLRTQSEDHIYAVPFGDKLLQETCIPKQGISLQSCSKLVKNQSDKSVKGPKDLGRPESNGLHYMCTPILTYGKLHSLRDHEDHAHDTASQNLNVTRFGAKRLNCPSRNFSGVRDSENSTKMVNSQIQSHMSETFGVQEEGRVSGLSVSIGLDGFNKESKTSSGSPSTETEEENCEDEPDAVTKEIVEQRKGYVRRVCSMFQKLHVENSNHSQGSAAANSHGKSGQNSKTSPLRNNIPEPSHTSPSQTQPSASPKHLFECVLLVGLTLSSDQGDVKSYEPYIQSKFPADVMVPSWIEHLCFPDASDWPISKSASCSKSCVGDDSKKRDSKTDDGMLGAVCRGRTYSLVITGPDGKRRFGYCRRVLPEGGSMCLPLNYCLISPYRANGFYLKVLAELESRHGQPEAERTAFLQELYSCPLPGPGQVPCPPPFSSPPSSFIASLRRPVDTRLEESDIMELCSCMEVKVFLDVFASLLLERKVLLTSRSLSKLSSCVEALQSVLYPFSWQHTFIPVLPAPMLDICNAPTPYIIGVLTGCSGQFPSITMDEGIMVDLDTSQCLQRVGDEGSILPSRIKRALQSVLRIVSGLNTSPKPFTSKKNSVSDEATPVFNVFVSEAFLRTFLMVVGHYPNHIVVQHDGQKVFQRESFIQAMPFSGVKMFLEWFTETAMFSAFINSCLEESGDGIFEQRARKFCEESEKDSLLFLKTYEAMAKKNKKLGERLKDWAPFA